MTDEEFNQLYEQRLKEGVFDELVYADFKGGMSLRNLVLQYGLSLREIERIIDEQREAGQNAGTGIEGAGQE